MRTIRVWCPVVTCLLLVAVAPPAVHGDGDPLEEYDFSGTATPTAFIAQSRSHVIQHGLWSAHRYIELDPHDGGLDGRKSWDLRGNRNESVRIFYGTRPMWRSEDTYTIAMGNREIEGDATKVPRWRVAHSGLKEIDEPCTSLVVEDVTGSGGTTLVIRYWGGGNRTSWTEVVHLTGKDPASAKVRSILRDPEPRFVDVDGDGKLEVVATTHAYDYLSEWYARGHAFKHVLRWSESHHAYRVAGVTVQARHRFGDKTPEAIAAERRKAWRELAEEPPQVSSITGQRQQILALDLHALLSVGRVEDAKSLFDAVDLPAYTIEGEGAVSKATWWTRFVDATRKDPRFEERCAVIPGLAELR